MRNIFIFLFNGILPLAVLAQNTAMIVSSQGAVSVLSNKKTEKSTQAVFEGKKYFALQAKVGQKIYQADVVMCGDDGKAKVIYNNGDVIIVSSGSSFIVPDQQKTAQLIYGKTRLIIDKEGPLSGVKIKTPSAVAGVRGTDLFIEFDSTANNTEVKVLRGEVEVQPQASSALDSGMAQALPEKSVTVKSGEVAQVAMTKNDVSEEPIKTEVKKITAQEVKEVTEATQVRSTETALSKEVQTKVAEVEKKAIENIIKDVKRYNPKSEIKLDEKNYTNIEDLNTVVTKADFEPERKKFEWNHYHLNYLNIEQSSGGRFNSIQFGYNMTWNVNDKFTTRLRTEIAPMRDRETYFPTLGIQPELLYYYKKWIFGVAAGAQVWLYSGAKDLASPMISADVAYQTHYDIKLLSKIDRIFFGVSHFEYPRNDRTTYLRLGVGMRL